MTSSAMTSCCRTGDGYRCVAEGCDTSRDCDRDAQCLYDRRLGRYACRCNDGYEGNGRRCTQVEGERSDAEVT